MTVAELFKKRKHPNKIIYDFIVYTYKEGEYLDKYGKPLEIKGTFKDLTVEDSVFTLEGE